MTQLISGIGVIKSLEGESLVACWYIETSTGEKYEPDSLKNELKVAGTRVGFLGEIETGQVSTCMTGTPIHLLDVWPVTNWPLYVAVLTVGGIAALGYILYQGWKKRD